MDNSNIENIVKTGYCNSSSHTCQHLQIPIGRWNGGVDYCRLFKQNIDRDERQRPERCEVCKEFKWI